MKIVSILILCSILSISKSDLITDNEAIENPTTISNFKPERRKLLIFPKTNVKFTVKSHNAYNIKPETSSVEDKNMTRKSLMAKIIPIPKKFNMETTEPVSRKPLMKLRSYTLKMSSQGKTNVKDDIHVTDKNYNERNSIKTDNKTKQLSLKRMDIEELKGQQDPKLFKSKFSKEEEQDRNEFIFLEKKNNHVAVKDLLYVSDEVFETTTIAHGVEKLRRKRSSNIIEEENMGSTVSPLKYTGRDSRLTNDLYFKNIHH